MSGGRGAAEMWNVALDKTGRSRGQPPGDELIPRQASPTPSWPTPHNWHRSPTKLPSRSIVVLVKENTACGRPLSSLEATFIPSPRIRACRAWIRRRVIRKRSDSIKNMSSRSGLVPVEVDEPWSWSRTPGRPPLLVSANQRILGRRLKDIVKGA